MHTHIHGTWRQQVRGMALVTDAELIAAKQHHERAVIEHALAVHEALARAQEPHVPEPEPAASAPPPPAPTPAPAAAGEAAGSGRLIPKSAYSGGVYT